VSDNHVVIETNEAVSANVFVAVDQSVLSWRRFEEMTLKVRIRSYEFKWRGKCAYILVEKLSLLSLDKHEE
jgi:hypothetical protein